MDGGLAFFQPPRQGEQHRPVCDGQNDFTRGDSFTSIRRVPVSGLARGGNMNLFASASNLPGPRRLRGGKQPTHRGRFHHYYIILVNRSVKGLVVQSNHAVR